ncbi:hypothetical protein B0A48_18508 [Cryoendolithus antarcticus]|uniref:Uncharacterized protein n=1 Tax=Cryoendolithus antarcticus TaxID=1507870 RepID=A0A1V8S8M1_9PEZI|nr:hypothetical protein B0A48_18508 [Cryoendolithus antarcticus]
MLLATHLFACLAIVAGSAEGAAKRSASTTSSTKSSTTSTQPTTTSITISKVSTTSATIATTSSQASSTTSTSSVLTTLSTSTYSPASSASSTSSSSVSASTSVVGGQTVAQTILVFARSSAVAYSAYSGLEGYGIPYQVVLVPSTGITLPALNSSTTQGNYGGIVILSEVSYSYTTGFNSALTTDQMNTLYTYQTLFGVRMVRLDCYPGTTYGTQTAIASTGCCGTGVEQLISFTNSTGFPTANIKTGATMSTISMYHYPAVITDSTTTWQIAKFAADSANQFTGDTTAAVINNFAGGQQMVFFTSWATDWSPTSAFLQHAYIHWMTRGLFQGARKVYLNTQIDDVHLTTDLYQPSDVGSSFRISPEGLTHHISWMQNLNTRLPSGSNYKLELGHNGNGDIINATNIEYSATVDV